MWLVLLLLLWLSPAAPNSETGSCLQPQPLCCLGTDHHCKRGSCYCDAFCHVVPDCCPDHHDLCNSASRNTKMMLQMVLRVENAPSAARISVDRMQSMVQRSLQTSLPGMSLSISVKGVRERASHLS
ncbi:uncharacterized protein AAES06_009481 [Glossophaga mutica]